jgi:HSP20 family protein
LPQRREIKSKRSKKNEIAIRTPESNVLELDRALSDYIRRLDNTWPSIFQGGWFGPRWWRSIELPETRRAFADLIDAGDEYRVRAEVPGIPKEKLNISVTPRGIKIEGEAETKIDEDKEGFVHKERTWSKVRRELAFPEEVVPDRADAQVKDGILEVKVPKKSPTEVKGHKIEVK